MKALVIGFVALLVCALLYVGVLASQLVGFDSTDVVSCEAPCTVEVHPGQTAGDVLNALHDAEVIVRDGRWPLWVSVNRPSCLQAGLHTLPIDATPNEVFEVLCAPGAAPERVLTVPEGTNQWELIDLLQAEGYGNFADAEDAFAGAPPLPAWAAADGATREGLLFPDTYRLAEDADAADVIERMAARADDVVGTLFDEHADALARLQGAYGVDRRDVLIIASLVEAEAQVAEERPRIARVFYNRLAAGMKLQTDPTCVYSAERFREVPSREACRDPNNRYSTYVIDGLPPGPINSPGRASIEAALTPSGDEGLLYFVAMRDGTGRHAFSTTLEEHEANVERYLR